MAGRVTERSFYPEIINILNNFGASGVSEISYNSDPDIIFEYKGEKFLLPVKIGSTNDILRKSFIQSERHRRESHIDNTILLYLPEEVRNIPPDSGNIYSALINLESKQIVSHELLQAEYNFKFGHFLKEFFKQLENIRRNKSEKYYSLELVTKLLQINILALMKELHLKENQVLKVIIDKDLFKSLGNIKSKDEESVIRFLSSYIFTSQILFLIMFQRKLNKPKIILPVNKSKLKKAFDEILDINYKPIFGVNVIDAIPRDYITDTYDLISRLQVEKIQYEIPGRIFHNLLPFDIRKLLAAFYTKPVAAEILSKLSIQEYDSKVFDPACGSGTILVSAYRRKNELAPNQLNLHKQFCESDILGSDIMPFAVHLTVANLAFLNLEETITNTKIIESNSLELYSDEKYVSGVRIGNLFPSSVEGKNMRGGSSKFKIEKVDVVLMNPPFTKIERGISDYLSLQRFREDCGGEVGLWGHFCILADSFLKDNGILGAVIPINLLRGRESSKVREFLFSEYTPLMIIKTTKNYGFSEDSAYRDILFIAKKGRGTKRSKTKFCLIKKDLNKLTSEDVNSIVNTIKRRRNLRYKYLDINSENLETH